MAHQPVSVRTYLLVYVALLGLTAALYCNRPEEAPERPVQRRSMER